MNMSVYRAFGASFCAIIAAASPIWAAPSRRPHAAVSPDGSRVAFLADHSKLRVLDRDGKRISETPVGSAPIEIAFTADSKRVAVCTKSTGLYVITEGQAAPDQAEAVGDCSDLSWSSDGTRLTYVLTLRGTLSTTIGANDRALKIWTAGGGAPKTLQTASVEDESEESQVPGLSYPKRPSRPDGAAQGAGKAFPPLAPPSKK
jgi:DNA-binding beta-propeller fold protein YncE